MKVKVASNKFFPPLPPPHPRAGVPTVSFSSALSLLQTRSRPLLRHSRVFFLRSARCSGNTRPVNTLVSEVRLGKASPSLSKQILCLSPAAPRSPANGSSVVADVTVLRGAQGCQATRQAATKQPGITLPDQRYQDAITL